MQVRTRLAARLTQLNLKLLVVQSPSLSRNLQIAMHLAIPLLGVQERGGFCAHARVVKTLGGLHRAQFHKMLLFGGGSFASRCGGRESRLYDSDFRERADRLRHFRL